MSFTNSNPIYNKSTTASVVRILGTNESTYILSIDDELINKIIEITNKTIAFAPNSCCCVRPSGLIFTLFGFGKSGVIGTFGETELSREFSQLTSGESSMSGIDDVRGVDAVIGVNFIEFNFLDFLEFGVKFCWTCFGSFLEFMEQETSFLLIIHRPNSNSKCNFAKKKKS